MIILELSNNLSRTTYVTYRRAIEHSNGTETHLRIHFSPLPSLQLPSGNRTQQRERNAFTYTFFPTPQPPVVQVGALQVTCLLVYKPYLPVRYYVSYTQVLGIMFTNSANELRGTSLKFYPVHKAPLPVRHIKADIKPTSFTSMSSRNEKNLRS